MCWHSPTWCKDYVHETEEGTVICACHRPAGAPHIGVGLGPGTYSGGPSPVLLPNSLFWLRLARSLFAIAWGFSKLVTALAEHASEEHLEEHRRLRKALWDIAMRGWETGEGLHDGPYDIRGPRAFYDTLEIFESLPKDFEYKDL